MIVDIDLIEDASENRERTSVWTRKMYRYLRGVVLKNGTVKVIVEKRGRKYRLAFGHYLLKAARECGLRQVQVDVIRLNAGKKRVGCARDLTMFRSAIEEVLF